MRTLGLFVKNPRPGEVKTRLAAGLGDDRAAAIYAAFLVDLIERFRTTGDERLLCITPADTACQQYFGAVSGDCYGLWPQPDGCLGGRMASFFQERLRSPADSVVLIGSDSPTLPREFVDRAFDLLEHSDCVFGPATDGGYYLVGQRARFRDLFADIAFSKGDVLRHTVQRVIALGASMALLPPWYDVDDVFDWEMLKGHLHALANTGSRDLPQATWLLAQDSEKPNAS